MEKKEYTLYNDTVMDHFLNPRNMGDVESADGVGEVGAAACGDIMKISLKIRDGKIEDARFKTFGCGSAIASSSMATELIKGRTLEEAKNFSNQEVVDALGGLPPGQDSLFRPRRGSPQGRDRGLRGQAGHRRQVGRGGCVT